MINCNLWRRILFLVAISLALVPAIVRAQETQSHDWPMYNRDVIGSRFNRDEDTIGPQNAGQLVEKWRFPAADSTEKIGVIHATPVVVNGYVYFGTATDPTFFKIAPDGKVCWKYKNPDRGLASAAVNHFPTSSRRTRSFNRRLKVFMGRRS